MAAKVIRREELHHDAIDGTTLVGFRWNAPDAPAPKGAAVLVHGMGQHVRRYEHVAAALPRQGFVVYGHDHRGHGASLVEGDVPGHLGAGGWASLVGDVGMLIDRTRELHPTLPVVAIAHGMGSFATQQLLLDGARRVDALVFTGTAAMDLLEPSLYCDVKLAAFNAAVLAPRTDFGWLSRDGSVVSAYRADPLCGFGIDVASLRDMVVGARRLADRRQMARLSRDLPLYIAVGSRDPVNAALSSLWPLVERYCLAGLRDVTVRVYDGARHDVFNERGRDDVIGDLLRWLQRVAGPVHVR